MRDHPFKNKPGPANFNDMLWSGFPAADLNRNTYKTLFSQVPQGVPERMIPEQNC